LEAVTPTQSLRIDSFKANPYPARASAAKKIGAFSISGVILPAGGGGEGTGYHRGRGPGRPTSDGRVGGTDPKGPLGRKKGQFAFATRPGPRSPRDPRARWIFAGPHATARAPNPRGRGGAGAKQGQGPGGCCGAWPRPHFPRCGFGARLPGLGPPKGSAKSHAWVTKGPPAFRCRGPKPPHGPGRGRQSAFRTSATTKRNGGPGRRMYSKGRFGPADGGGTQWRGASSRRGAESADGAVGGPAGVLRACGRSTCMMMCPISGGATLRPRVGAGDDG